MSNAAVAGSCLAICCNTVMKNLVWSEVALCKSEYRAAVRSASLRTRNHCSIADSSSLKFESSEAAAISSRVDS